MLIEWVILPGKGLEEVILDIFDFPGEEKFVELVSVDVHVSFNDFHLEYFVLLQALQNAFIAADGFVSIHVLFSISDFEDQPESLFRSGDYYFFLLQNQSAHCPDNLIHPKFKVISTMLWILYLRIRYTRRSCAGPWILSVVLKCSRSTPSRKWILCAGFWQDRLPHEIWILRALPRKLVPEWNILGSDIFLNEQ